MFSIFNVLDAAYLAIRFRKIDEQDRFRRHMRYFVNGIQNIDLNLTLARRDGVSFIQALTTPR